MTALNLAILRTLSQCVAGMFLLNSSATSILVVFCEPLIRVSLVVLLKTACLVEPREN